MSNVDICHISVALNINFNQVKDFRDTKVCRTLIFEGSSYEQEIHIPRSPTELQSELCFLRQSFKK